MTLSYLGSWGLAPITCTLDSGRLFTAMFTVSWFTPLLSTSRGEIWVSWLEVFSLVVVDRHEATTLAESIHETKR